MKRIVFFIAVVLLSLITWAKSPRQTVVFDVDIHCQGCIAKIEKNIAFERGVKDLECSLDDKTVTVVFDPEKTDIPKLQAAFSRINKTASVRSASVASGQQKREPDSEVDAQTGASSTDL